MHATKKGRFIIIVTQMPQPMTKQTVSAVRQRRDRSRWRKPMMDLPPFVPVKPRRHLAPPILVALSPSTRPLCLRGTRHTHSKCATLFQLFSFGNQKRMNKKTNTTLDYFLHLFGPRACKMQSRLATVPYFDWRANSHWHAHPDVHQLSLFVCTCENIYGDRSAFFSHPRCTERCCRRCGQLVRRQAPNELGGDWAFQALYCCRVCANHWTVRSGAGEEACPECSKAGLVVMQRPHVIGAGKQVDDWTRANHAVCAAMCDQVTKLDPVVFDFQRYPPDQQRDYVIEWVCNARPDIVARYLRNAGTPPDAIQSVLVVAPRANDIRVICAGARLHALLVEQRRVLDAVFGPIESPPPPVTTPTPQVISKKEDIKTDPSVCQFCKRRVGASRVRERWCDEGHNTWGCDTYTTCGAIGTTCCHCDQ